MRNILILSQAEEILDEITQPLFSQIISRIELLRDFPELGGPMKDDYEGYRSLVVEMFLVIYRVVSDSKIEVALIHHCRRKPPSHF